MLPDGRPKLLFISQCLPYPPHSGVTNRTFHILKELSVGFDVTLVAFSRPNHQRTTAARAAAVEALSQYARVLPPTPISSDDSVLKRVAIHIRSLLSFKPYTYFVYSSRTLRDHLAEVGHDYYDLVHLDSLDLYRWLPEIEQLPTACTHHSVESLLLRSRGEHLKPRLLGRYVSWQSHLIERIERDYTPRFDVNIMMSTSDAERLRRIAGEVRTAIVPNGVDTDKLRSAGAASENENRVVFLGPSYMFPNRDGILWFLEECWQVVRQENPSATLRIVGKVSERDREEYMKHENVEAIGFADDLQAELGAAACCIAPLRVGGGTRLKILDYWAVGRAVVSTSVGCEGLDAQDGINILVRDDPVGFGSAVGRVLREAGLRRDLGAQARSTVETKYSWEAIGRLAREALDHAMDIGGGTPV